MTIGVNLLPGRDVEKRIILWVLGFTLMLFSVCFGEDGRVVSGKIVLDREEIEECGPFSGFVELTALDDVELCHGLRYPFRYYDGNIDVIIERPDGEMVDLYNNFLDWNNVGIEVLRRPLDGNCDYSFLWESKVKIRLPVFLLKVDDVFLFDLPGVYRVKYVFNAIPGRPAVETSVSVVAADTGEKQDFVTWVQDSADMFSPFSWDPDEIEIQENNGYWYDYCIVNAYQIGGPMLKTWWNTRREGNFFKGVGFGAEQTEIAIGRGLSWGRKCSANLEFWDNILAKRTLFKNKAGDVEYSLWSGKGVLFYVP